VGEKYWSFALYHDFLHLHDEEQILWDGCESGRLTRFLSLWRMPAMTTGSEAPSSDLLTALHVVQGAHENGWSPWTIYPLHLSEMHLPARCEGPAWLTRDIDAIF
jgi:hypothetical protein